MEPQNSIQARLLERYIQGSASQSEVEQLFTWLREYEPEFIVGLDELLESSYTQAFAQPGHLDNSSSNRILEELLRWINNKSDEKPVEFTAYKGRSIRWYWPAASIIILLGIGIYFYIQKGKQETVIATGILKDVSAPTANRAMITLADGSRVFLDSVGSGQLAQSGNVKLVKLANGQIAYQTATGEVLKEIQYNTLTNPTGSKVIDIQLSDGSHVWLNAGSSITYPIAFTGDERRVELQGEGYFEVARNPKKRFIVSTNSAQTQVFGTHFNIRAYADEPDTKITLLEGSISVDNKTTVLKVRPGEQALISATQIRRTRPDLDQVIAWKEGYFNFDDMSLKAIMKELERWYAIKVLYEGEEVQTMTFGGNINRNASLNDILTILKKLDLQISWNAEIRELRLFSSGASR
ncbi:MAG: FecR domain-containing protein [Niabella sp.]